MKKKHKNSGSTIEVTKSQAGNEIVINSFQVPNYYVDTVLPLLTPEEWVVLSLVFRKILGWVDKISLREDHISFDQVCNGCNFCIETVESALKSLEKYGLITIKIPRSATDKRKGNIVRIQDESVAVDINGLLKRKSEKKERNIARMAKARESRAMHRSVGQNAMHSVGQNGVRSV